MATLESQMSFQSDGNFSQGSVDMNAITTSLNSLDINEQNEQAKTPVQQDFNSVIEAIDNFTFNSRPEETPRQQFSPSNRISIPERRNSPPAQVPGNDQGQIPTIVITQHEPDTEQNPSSEVPNTNHPLRQTSALEFHRHERDSRNATNRRGRDRTSNRPQSRRHYDPYRDTMTQDTARSLPQPRRRYDFIQDTVGRNVLRFQPRASRYARLYDPSINTMRPPSSHVLRTRRFRRGTSQDGNVGETTFTPMLDRAEQLRSAGWRVENFSFMTLDTIRELSASPMDLDM